MPLFGEFRSVRRLRRDSAKPSVGVRDKPSWRVGVGREGEGGGLKLHNTGPMVGVEHALGKVLAVNLQHDCVYFRAMHFRKVT